MMSHSTSRQQFFEHYRQDNL